MRQWLPTKPICAARANGDPLPVCNTESGSFCSDPSVSAAASADLQRSYKVRKLIQEQKELKILSELSNSRTVHQRRPHGNAAADAGFAEG